MAAVFEPGMKMFRVRFTRDGADIATFVLPAFDTKDAIARAKLEAAESNQQGWTENPFDNVQGLEVWVKSLG